MLDGAQLGDVLLVLVVGFGEGVSAGAVGDEEHFLGARRIGRSLDRGPPRIGDRPGRQTFDDVGVVRRLRLDIRPADRAAERAFAEHKAVDDGRIGLQLHLLLEPVDEHRRDPRALLGLAGLFLDDRREDDELVRRAQRQVGIAALPDLAHQPVLRLAHALDELFTREAAIEVIAVRQQASFARDILDVAGENVALQQPGDDLLGRQAFRNGQLMLHHLAVDDGLDHVADAGMLLEEIFAGLQSAARFECEHSARENHAMLVDHAFVLKQVGDVHHPRTRRDGDDLVLQQRPRRFETALAEHDRAAARQQCQNEQGENRIADDDQRVARTPRRSLRDCGARWQRHVLGLERGARAARGNAFLLHQ